MYKHINQYSTDVFNNYKINKTHNVKKTCYNLTNDVVIDKHNTSNTNDTYNITKNNNLFNVTDDNYYTKQTSRQLLSPTLLHDITITSMNII